MSASAQLKPIKRVLIINDLGIVSSPGFAELDQAILSVLQKSSYQIELYDESLQLTLFPDLKSRHAFSDSLILKYSGRQPDLIIAAGSESLKLLAESHEAFIRGTPIIFCALLGEVPDKSNSGLHLSGVISRLQPEQTLEAAIHLLPGTTQVVVVGGTGKFDEVWERVAKQAFQKYESKLEFTYLTDLTMSALLERLRHLPPNTIVYHTSIAQDAEGERFIGSAQSVPLVAAAANAPVFVMDDVDLRAGTVGGALVDWPDAGRAAGELAVRVLNGERPEDIPIVVSKNAYMFDWRALKRWGIKEKNLPPGSIVLNRQPTAWELYKWYIVGGLCLLLVQTSLIVGLSWQRRIRRKAEADLAIAYDRLRLAIEAGKAVGWELDIKTGQNRWFGDLQNMFGIQAESLSGQIDFYGRLHPEDRGLVWQAVAVAKQDRAPYSAEFRVIRDDETIRWVTARGKFYYGNNGDAERMVGMSLDITDRKVAEQQVREAQDRLAAIVSSAMDAIIAIDEEQRIVLFNPAAEKIFACSHCDAIGSPIERFVPERFRAEHRAHIRRFSESGVTNRAMGGMRGLRANGEEFPIDSSISQTQPGGTKLYTVVVRDITARVQAEEAVRESERRFRLLANTAPVMIWTSGTDQLCDYVNRPWLDFKGRTLEQELGNGWVEGIHDEDVNPCLRKYTEAFENREAFEMEFRLRRRDGEYRWIFDRGVPRFSADWTFAGYIGCCIDVTDRKRAEEALSAIGRRLIEAHEEERTRIGRELHDDINQKLALLAVELDQWSKEKNRSNFSEHLSQAQMRIMGISKDVQALSHRLHSSKLDYLGLARAANSFCREFCEQAEVEIRFSYSAIPPNLPKDVSLCLFRVLQESLQNAVKYSGVKSFNADLRGTSDGIELVVSDNGKGFDELEVFSRQGLGLISMRERLQMVHGRLDINTRPGAGTTITARVPLQATVLRAAG